MSGQVGSGHVAIFPTFTGFRSKVTGETQASGRSGGQAFSKAFQATAKAAAPDLSRLKSDIAKTSQALSKARLAEQDATGKARVAQTQLNEALKKYGAESSQVVAAQERLATAQRRVSVAQDASRGASNKLRDAQSGLQRAQESTATSAGQSSNRFVRAWDSASGKLKDSVTRSVRGAGDSAAREGTSSGRRGGSAFATAFKAVSAAALLVGAGAASVNFLKGSVAEASNLAEVGSKLDQVFGKAGSTFVEGFASKGPAALGQTKLQVENAAASFGIFGKSAGLSGKQLGSFSTDFVQLSTDLASFHNADPSEVVDALGSALRGEAEPMRKYGVLMDDASLKAEAMKQGLITTTKQALTPQQKVLAAHALIMKQTSDAQGDFAKTSGGLANQQRIFTAQTGQLKATLGAALLPIITRVVTLLNAGMGPALAWISGTAIPAVTTAFRVVWTAISPVFTSLRSSGPGIMASLAPLIAWVQTALIPAVMAVVASFRGWIAVAVPIVQQFVSGMMARIRPMLPQIKAVFATIGGIVVAAMGLIQAIISRVTSVVSAIWSRWGGLIMSTTAKVFGGLLAVVSPALSLVRSVIQTVTALIKGDWKGAWDGVKKVLSDAWDTMKAAAKVGIDAIVTVVGGIAEKVKGKVSDFGTTLYQAGKDLLDGLLRGVTDKFDDVMTKIADLASRIKEKVTSAFEIGSPSKWFRREVGARLGEGLSLGMVDSTGLVAAGADKMVAAAKPSLQSTFEAALDWSGSSTGMPSGLGASPSSIAQAIRDGLASVQLKIIIPGMAGLVDARIVSASQSADMAVRTGGVR